MASTIHQSLPEPRAELLAVHELGEIALTQVRRHVGCHIMHILGICWAFMAYIGHILSICRAYWRVLGIYIGIKPGNIGRGLGIYVLGKFRGDILDI